MFSAIYNTLLLFSVCTHVLVEVEGLPIVRQGRDTIDDLLAGKDFLQVLLDLPTTKAYPETTTTIYPVTLPTSLDLEKYTDTFTPVVRESRSTKFTSVPKVVAFEDNLMPTQQILKNEDLDGLRKVVNVKISSSKESRIYSTRKMNDFDNKVTTESPKISTTTTEEVDLPVLAVEDRQSLVAEANKHEFGVEEVEPITRDAGYTEELPANVQSIPIIKKLSDFEKTSGLLKELSQEKLKDKLPPFHHTVIYHDNRRESTLPRSVSYSAVVQNIQEDHWKNSGTDINPTQPTMNENYFSTKEFQNDFEPKQNYMMTSSEKHMEPTEMNWGIQQKQYNPKNNLPIVYGQPEQNYEVDEAVSVQTNGRTHGIQPTSDNLQNKPASKSKNGYVIEGRKERRYRVEERTPDGFIVGEFGIVNHDDGLLRGVRYTADETINPKLIYDTLMKFLSL